MAGANTINIKTVEVYSSACGAGGICALYII